MTSTFTTMLINLHVGVAMGCTILPILFVMAIQIILDVTISYVPVPSLDEVVDLSA